MKDLQLSFPTARNTDPITSHKAGDGLKIRAGTQQWFLLNAFLEHPVFGMTDEEAGVFTGLANLPRCCYWKRCSELRQAGYIEPNGEERLSTVGNKQQVCIITKAGRKALMPF